MEYICPNCQARLSDGERTQQRYCAFCHAVLPPAQARGRLRRYCNRACRDGMYYQKKHGEDDWVDTLVSANMVLEERLVAAFAEIDRLRVLIATGKAPKVVKRRGRRKMP